MIVIAMQAVFAEGNTEAFVSILSSGLESRIEILAFALGKAGFEEPVFALLTFNVTCGK